MSEPGAKVPAKDPPPTSPDPFKGFRGVAAGALILEAIVVALALPVVARLGGGISSVTGWLVIALAVALVVLCRFVSRPWSVVVVLALQVALIAFVVTLPALAIIGVVFLVLWLWLLWLRRDVARRMAQGRLPSQRDDS